MANIRLQLLILIVIMMTDMITCLNSCENLDENAVCGTADKKTKRCRKAPPHCEGDACYLVCVPEVDCGNPYTINFGTLDLDEPGKTTFAATASVNCNAGYIASPGSVSCASDGKWSLASCDIGKSGTWTGHFMYRGDQYPLTIELEFQGNVIKGSGLDDIGEYTVEGTADVSGEVVFLKQYIGRYSINCKGTLKENRCEISGTYTVGPGNSDSFTMLCE